MEEYVFEDGKLYAELICKTLRLEDDGGVKGEALVSEMRNTFDSFSSFLPKVSNELVTAVRAIQNPGLLADFYRLQRAYELCGQTACLEDSILLRRAELFPCLWNGNRRCSH